MSECTFFCIVAGSWSLFPITIDVTKNVGQLKQAIKAQAPKELGEYDAHALTLRQCNVKLDDSDEHLQKVQNLNLSEIKPPKPWITLAQVFKTCPSPDSIRIIVTKPAEAAADERGEGKGTHQQAPSPSKSEIDTVTKPLPTLRDYLLPDHDFKDAHLPKLTDLSTVARDNVTPATRTGFTTAPFDPTVALDWNRIPYEVHLCDMLPIMLEHFRQVLLEYPNVDLPPNEGTKAAYRAAVDKFNELELHQESAVSRAADGLLSLVLQTYKGLTGSKIKSPDEVASSSRIVITDYVISRDSESKQVLLLWENKAPAVFRHCVDSIQTIGDSVKFNLNQVRWEGWQAILAKLAWHSSDLDQKPRWAILYGGNEFIAIYIVYVKDVYGIDRPVLYCSHTHDAMDTEFPLNSVALYMALTADKPTEFLQHLQPSIPSIPAALQIKDSDLRRATLQELLDESVVNIKVAGDRAAPQQLVRIAVDKEEEEVEKMLLGDHVESLLDEKTRRRHPTIFLTKPPKVSNQASVYYSCDRRLVVKISHGDKLSREALRKEAQMYDNLTGETAVWAKKYGLFQIGKKALALVLSNEGEPVRFESMSNADRLRTLRSLHHLHQAGINHGDIAERNIVQRRGHWPVVIDFSHSYYHLCKGEDRCQELIEARNLLKPIESFTQKRVGMVLILFIILFTTQQLTGLLRHGVSTTLYYPLFLTHVV